MNDNASHLHSGGCLCGAVRYEVVGPPVVVAHCHCEDCQRTSGAGHSTAAMFASGGFTLTGTVSEYALTSDNGNEVTKTFCPVCGSSLLGRNTAMEGFVTIGLGSFDDASKFEPEVTVFARNRKPWDIMDESLETHQAQPGWKPGDSV